MTAIAFKWDNAVGSGDMQLTPTGLATDTSLAAAIWMSLFSDRRAHPDDRVDGDDRRGWWGDAYATEQLGSRLWLLRRAKRTEETRRRAEDYAREALAWLIKDEVAARVDVTATWIGPNFLKIAPVIYHRDGGRSGFQWDWAWST